MSTPPMPATIIERARRYVAGMPAAIMGQGGDMATFKVALALVHGFDLTICDARPILAEYSYRCKPPWSAHDLDHKLDCADKYLERQQRGYLISTHCRHPDVAPQGERAKAPVCAPASRVEFNPAKLAAVAKPWARKVNANWLADRSAVDPHLVSAAGFLTLLYRPGENVLVFRNQRSQGEAQWPAQTPPLSGPEGVWFLPAPVDGLYHPNPRTGSQSRRSEESVTAFRYLLLESDQADVGDWLGFIVQVPLPIEALYTSGGRSIHALARVNCRTKAEWDQMKGEMGPFLRGCQVLGADPGALSAVRLSRLPGCFRPGKTGADGHYQKYSQPRLQRLLYVRPAADGRPICELPAVRDVAAEYQQLERDAVDSDSGNIGELDPPAPPAGRMSNAA